MLKTLQAPAIWASAIINLDYSGLDSAEKSRLNTWLADNDLSFVDCLTCESSGIGQFEGELTDLNTYTFREE